MKKERIYLSLCLCLLCASCTNDPIVKDDDENPHSSQGELVPIEIVLDPTMGYNEQAPPATRIGMDGRTENVPILSEWVPIKKPFSAIGAPYEGPTMVAMELRQDDVAPATGDPIKTRRVTTMSQGTYFRLITFIKNRDGQYVFHNVSTYTAGYYDYPTLPPILEQGEAIRVPLGSTFRVVGYSVDTKYPGDIGYSYGWYEYGQTPIDIPDYLTQFYAYDSGEIVAKSTSQKLPIRFYPQYTQLSIETITEGFIHSSVSIYDAFVRDIGGGTNKQWIVGSDPVEGDGVTGTAGDDIHFDSPTIYYASYRCLPFEKPKKISIHFNSVRLGVHTTVKEVEFTSKTAVQLKAGKYYTMTLIFKKVLGTQLEPEQMDECRNEADKIALSKLVWADGNLTGTQDGQYEWTNLIQSEKEKYNTGCFYLPMSTYTVKGGTVGNGKDPCLELNKDIYGNYGGKDDIGRWRTPTKVEMEMLARCVREKANLGRHFLSFVKAAGVFLMDGGYRTGFDLGGTDGQYYNQKGRYATSDVYTDGNGKTFPYVLDMSGGAVSQVRVTYIDPTIGVNVRCVRTGSMERPSTN